MARHRRAVLLAWLLLLIVCAALYPSLEGVLSAPDYGIDGSQSKQVEHLLNSRRFQGVGSEQDSLVFYSPGLRATDPAYRAFVVRVLRAARMQPGVASVITPYGTAGAGSAISADRHAVVARVGLNGDARSRFVHASHLQDLLARMNGDRVQAWLTGFSFIAKDLAQVEKIDGERAETLGIPIALLILLVALGALVAAMIPLLIASAGLLLTYAVIAVLGRVINFDAFLLTIVTMIGLGIGIDYSLFIVARFREELSRSPTTPRRERQRIRGAVGVTVATSGRTILYSGVIVVLSLSSLLIIHSSMFREFAIGTLVIVLCTLAAALTLLPALLAQLGPKINAGSLPPRLQPSDVRVRAGEGRAPWARWAYAMMRRPVLTAAGVSILLVAAAVPVHNLRFGLNVALPSLSQTPSGRAAQVLGRYFSPGMVGPLEVVVAGSATGAPQAPDRAGARELVRSLRHDKRVTAIGMRRYPSGVLLMVVPSVPTDSSAADRLVRHIRGDLAPRVRRSVGATTLVGGWAAQGLDDTEESSAKLPVVLGITLGLALIFLLIVFRSVVLPIKAVLMNLLATGAALGLLVLIFQDGHGERLLGFSSTGFIQSFLPLSMFVLLFGLSMDYEVFLIRRMQETWRRTGDNRLAVASGVEHTARPISAAAAIMVAVFGSFVTANILELKQFGFALAAAIAIDATLIRLVLVPALMCLLGKRNWWLPESLGRMLPRLEID